MTRHNWQFVTELVPRYGNKTVFRCKRCGSVAFEQVDIANPVEFSMTKNWDEDCDSEIIKQVNDS